MLSNRQKQIYDEALTLSRTHKRVEHRILLNLIDAMENDLLIALEISSLFQFCTERLGFAESFSQAASQVAKKCQLFPSLLRAVGEGSLTILKVQRFASILSSDNVEEWIEFAKTHSCRKIDERVAALNPKKAQRAAIRVKSEMHSRVSLDLSNEAVEDLRHIRELECTRQKKVVSLEEALEGVLKSYLERYDPVKRAERAVKRKRAREEKKAGQGEKAAAGKVRKGGVNRGFEKEEAAVNARPEVRSDGDSESAPCTYKISATDTATDTTPPLNPASPKKPAPTRIPLSAQEKHTVHLRDQGRCAHTNPKGERCPNRQWLEIHHKIPVSLGGSNDPSNLITLCGFHHDLAHQMEFPLVSK